MPYFTNKTDDDDDDDYDEVEDDDELLLILKNNYKKCKSHLNSSPYRYLYYNIIYVEERMKGKKTDNLFINDFFFLEY